MMSRIDVVEVKGDQFCIIIVLLSFSVLYLVHVKYL